MDGKKICTWDKDDFSLEEVKEIAERVFKLNESVANYYFDLDMTYLALSEDVRSQSFTLFVKDLENCEIIEIYKQKAIPEALDKWELIVMSPSKYAQLSKMVDGVIEAVDFDLGIKLAKEDFSSLFKACLEKFSEVENG